MSAWAGVAAGAAIVLSAQAMAQQARPLDARAAAVLDHWSAERRAAAIPRDLVVDPRGLGYLRMRDGALAPHGHAVAAQAPEAPRAQPSSGDTSPPAIANPNPATGATIGASYTFSATVTDASGVKSVTFQLQKGGGTPQSFAATKASGSDVWSVSLQGFTDGDWTWTITAKDRSKGSGNPVTSGPIAFKVDTGTTGGGGGTGGTVTDAEWTGGGVVQNAAGRIYFEMPSNARRKGPWNGYVCSGTVATDGVAGRSVIITAAHCVYDDVNKAFARNVMFIPDQAGTSGSGTDLDCSNDPIGCWVPSLGVVDVNWTTRTFPDNVAWDYAFYVVQDTAMHLGAGASEILDQAAGSLGVSFTVPNVGTSDATDFTHALGYSYDSDPMFMYCAEDMTIEGTANWWLPSCGLTGGASGGPWIQPMTANGSGPIVSVNSWGYTNQPGMAGPKLSGTSASCVFDKAKATGLLASTFADGNAGETVSCP